jgi:uncharacterized membrane protein
VSLQPLLAEPAIIQIHAFAAMAAFAVALTQLALPKGTLRHRVVGYAWAILIWGPFSWIHLLSVYTLVMLPIGITHARRHRIKTHRRVMLGLFFGALVIAGVFTLWPGRVMHEVVFGS